MPTPSLPTRALPAHPDLDQLKRQAKELLEAFRAGAGDAVTEVTAHYRDADPATFALHDAQLALARAYGFDSWPKLKAFVEGATDERLLAAVRANDAAVVRAMLTARPELAGRGGALHAAVMARSAELVRLLMEHGAHAHVGIYPHREATGALTIAEERGYDEIVAIIRDVERRRPSSGGTPATPVRELFEAIRSGVVDRVRAIVAAAPELARAPHPQFDVSPLDVAAMRTGAWGEQAKEAGSFAALAAALTGAGAEMTARAAVALGLLSWLRAKHAAGTLVNQVHATGGLLRIAVSHDRPEVLEQLLEWGFDPDERTRFEEVSGDEVVFTSGMPLWHATATGRQAMAGQLLAHGANPNADVYASGTPINQAYGRRDQAMIALLERHGGRLDAGAVGLYRLTERARELLAATPGATAGDDGQTVAERLLWGGACGGDPEIVRLALEHVTWPREDPRWFTILEQPLRIWNHGSGFWAHDEWDRGTYLTCLRLILERCAANIRGRTAGEHPFGLTILHSVAGSRGDHMTDSERVAFAALLLDAGARLDLRDEALRSTPLGWACRWGRTELVELFLRRGADPVEAAAEPWASPLAWARKKGHAEIERMLTRCET